MKLINGKFFGIALAAVFVGLFILGTAPPAVAKNMRVIVQQKNGEASTAWANAGVKKFMRRYAGKWRYKVVSGSETSWKRYKNTNNAKMTRVTYNINGHKRNVAYLWIFDNGKSTFVAVANASGKQQGLGADIRRVLK